MDRFAGLIAMGVVLFWVFRDAEGTNNIVHALGGANRNVVGGLMGATQGVLPARGLRGQNP